MSQARGKAREWWICWDDTQDNPRKFVRDTKPSGISGGGSMIDVHVIEKSAYDKAVEALKEMDCEYQWVSPNSVNCHDKYHAIEKCTKCRTLKSLGEIS